MAIMVQNSDVFMETFGRWVLLVLVVYTGSNPMEPSLKTKELRHISVQSN